MNEGALLVGVFLAGVLLVDVVPLIRVSSDERRVELAKLTSYVMVSVAGGLPSLWIARDQAWATHSAIVAGLVMVSYYAARRAGHLKATLTSLKAAQLTIRAIEAMQKDDLTSGPNPREEDVLRSVDDVRRTTRKEDLS